jgi:pimeloyl-ACP methyl ester carboxylesterase
LVHGITGSPAVFEHPVGQAGSLAEQVSAITNVSVWTFDYDPESLQWVTNNRIGPTLAAGIGCLATATGHKAILVDHSMGGLATQLAVSEQGTDGMLIARHVAEVITIGTPFLGSVFLSLIQKARVVGVVSNPALSAVTEAYLSYCAGRLDDAFCPAVGVLGSPDGTALEYRSTAIRALPKWPTGLPVHDIAGNLSLSIGFGPLSVSANVGDLLVTLDSATAHNSIGSPVVVSCHASLTHHDVSCWHSDLPHDAEVVAVVVKDVQDVVGTGRGQSVPVVVCPTTGPGASGPPQPSSVEVGEPLGGLPEMSVYVTTSASDMVLAPSGWECQGVVGSDGTGVIVAWPRVAPTPNLANDPQSLRYGLYSEADPGCDLCVWLIACPFFSASTLQVVNGGPQGWGIPCPAVTDGERILSRGQSLVTYAIYPHWRGTADNLSSSFTDFGSVWYGVDAYGAQAYQTDCDLPSNERSLCEVALGWKHPLPLKG